jgi:DNA-binding CsgD family transcriptional regulator
VEGLPRARACAALDADPVFRIVARVTLLGRADERAVLDSLIDDVRRGESRSLVVWGEAGIGKTALLESLVESASDLTVVRAVGVESEMELAYASLHQLCTPMLERLETLPAPQRQALEMVFGLSAGAAPDRFLVGLAVLSLFSEVADQRPLLCVVDDAQWLDQASALTLAFVARRLLADPVGIVFGAREPVEALQHLSELEVHGLRNADARALLSSAVRFQLDERVLDRIVAETRGNPLAMLELPRGLTATELAGGFALPRTQGLSRRIEESFVRQLHALTDAARRLVLLAAAEPIGDPLLLSRAATRLRISPAAGDEAATAELLEIGERVTFRHPLARSAVYRSAPAGARRDVHRALADATDRDVDPDRRAWHLASAAAGPDEQVATELERCAVRAQTRGALTAAAAFLQRAVALTEDAARGVERALAAAQANLQCGAPETALTLLAQVQAGPVDDLQRARAHLLHGQAAFASSHGADAPPLLLAAARELERLDPVSARDTYLDALAAALFVGRLAGDVGVLEVARAARSAPASSGRPQDLLLDGLALVITEGYGAGATLLKRAVTAFRTGDMPPAEAMRWLWLAAHAAHDLWDDESWEALCERHIGLARQAGALTILPIALSSRIGLHLFSGELATAASLNEEVAAVTEATGSRLPPYGVLALAAFRGREAEAAELIREARAELGPRGEGMGLTLVEHAAAMLYNGLGRYKEASDAAQRGAAHPHELAFSTWSLPQLVEAAVRSHQPALADDAMQRLAQTTGPSGTDWALGVEARSRALVIGDGGAERLYREAIDRLGRTRVRAEHARAHLLYGEWLRREGRRVDAREQLRTAHDMFAAMGVEAFAERAERELRATGERVRKRAVETREQLTSQEVQVARLARDGLSNPEIGARLFISPRTAEYHLRKVFTKLGIGSRHELSRVPSQELATTPAS